MACCRTACGATPQHCASKRHGKLLVRWECIHICAAHERQRRRSACALLLLPCVIDAAAIGGSCTCQDVLQLLLLLMQGLVPSTMSQALLVIAVLLHQLLQLLLPLLLW